MIPTWVMADNGRLYRDPVVRGINPNTGAAFFLCFDDTEPPELVISIHGRYASNVAFTGRQIQKEAREILRFLEIEGTVKTGPFYSTRCFSPDSGKGPYRRAASLFLTIAAPLPSGLLVGGGALQPSGGDCAVYSLGKAWG